MTEPKPSAYRRAGVARQSTTAFPRTGEKRKLQRSSATAFPKNVRPTSIAHVLGLIDRDLITLALCRLRPMLVGAIEREKGKPSPHASLLRALEGELGSLDRLCDELGDPVARGQENTCAWLLREAGDEVDET